MRKPLTSVDGVAGATVTVAAPATAAGATVAAIATAAGATVVGTVGAGAMVVVTVGTGGTVGVAVAMVAGVVAPRQCTPAAAVTAA